MKMLRYIQDRGGSVKLKPIEAVPLNGNRLRSFQKHFRNEKIVTARINNLMHTALEIKIMRLSAF
jgi:ferritin